MEALFEYIKEPLFVHKYICLTSLMHAKPKEKMEFPTLFPHYA